jgi:hypothetical protein
MGCIISGGRSCSDYEKRRVVAGRSFVASKLNWCSRKYSQCFKSEQKKFMSKSKKSIIGEGDQEGIQGQPKS